MTKYLSFETFKYKEELARAVLVVGAFFSLDEYLVKTVNMNKRIFNKYITSLQFVEFEDGEGSVSEFAKELNHFSSKYIGLDKERIVFPMIGRRNYLAASLTYKDEEYQIVVNFSKFAHKNPFYLDGEVISSTYGRSTYKNVNKLQPFEALIIKVK